MAYQVASILMKYSVFGIDANLGVVQIYLDLIYAKRYKMRQLLTVWVLLCQIAFAQTTDDCMNEGLAMLKKNYPRGLQILNRLNSEKKKEMMAIMHCDRDRNTLIMSLETVIHEAVHSFDALLTMEGKGETFYLTDDSVLILNLPDKMQDVIASKDLNQIYSSLSEVEQTDLGYAKNYLQDDIGSQNFFSLMDELNAYTNGLDAAIRLPRLSGGYSHSPLAGPLAMTTFILRYYEFFEKTDAAYFKDVLMSKSVRPIVKILIIRGLDKVKEGRDIKDLQAHFETWEQVIQAEEHQRMLKMILG